MTERDTRKRTQYGSGRGAMRRRALRSTWLVVLAVPSCGPRDSDDIHDVGPVAAESLLNAELRARQRRKRARPSSRGRPGFAELLRDTRRSTDRVSQPAHLRIALLTYVSHVGRSSRLPAQRVQNISATLTCAANTTVAILESHSTIATDQARMGATPRGSSCNCIAISRHRCQTGMRLMTNSE